MKNNNMNAPEIRFPGFTDPWEQRKFKDLFRERREKTTVEDEDVLLSCAITGIYLNSELFGHQRGRSNIGYLKIKMNDLILSAQNLHLGNANVNKRFEHGIISPAYKVYEIKECNPDFIQAWVKQESTKKFFLDVTTEGASQCRKNIDWNMLANSTIPVPSESEQSVLGSFITVLDNAITLHQRKCDELKIYKKGLLQQMFPQPGEAFPRVRFPGFTDPWEQRKLSEIAEKVTQKNTEMKYKETLTNSAEHGIINQTDFFDKEISNADKIDGYFIVDHDDFVYNPRISSLAPVGPINRNKLNRSGVMSPLYTVFRTHDINTLYLEWFFKSDTWHSFMKFNGDSGARSDRFSIRNDLFFTMPISVPSKEEQSLIGAFFEQVDANITLHQRKCDELKNYKKGLLQKMFV